MMAAGKEGAVDELFEVRNQFYLGNYQQAINEASTKKLVNKDLAQERELFLLRSYLAQRKYGIVVNEVKDTATAPLRAVRLAAEYFQAAGNQEKQDAVLARLKDLQNTSTEPVVHVMTATVLMQTENYGDALRVLRSGGDNLECISLSVQALLKMNRLDLARPELARMRAIEDDATLTVLCEAWINCYVGGEKYNEAFFIYQELAQKYAVTVKLLNGQAICHMLQGKYADAEDLLMEALERRETTRVHERAAPQNNGDPETLINLAVCAQNTGKGTDVVNRYLGQLRDSDPRHPFLADSDARERAFDRGAGRFIAAQ